MPSLHCFGISILIIIILSANIASSMFSIESVDWNRDQNDVVKMLSHDAKAVAYDPIRFAIDRSRKNVITEVMRMNNKTIAVIQHRTQRACDWSLDYKKYGYIRLLAVDRNHRNKGYGKQLLENVVNRMEKSNVSFIYLTTLKKIVPQDNCINQQNFLQIKNRFLFYSLFFYPRCMVHSWMPAKRTVVL